MVCRIPRQTIYNIQIICMFILIRQPTWNGNMLIIEDHAVRVNQLHMQRKDTFCKLGFNCLVEAITWHFPEENY